MKKTRACPGIIPGLWWFLTENIAVSSGSALSPGGLPVYANPDMLFMDMKRLTGIRRGAVFPSAGRGFFPVNMKFP
jgi:hypothetical protein